MRKGLITAGLVVALLLVVYFLTAGTYNRFVTMEEQIKNSQAEIANQLQRRFDLIPNLVETVKGFAAQEKSIMEDIAAARTKYAGAQGLPDKLAANDALSNALGRLLVIVENYPDLKSNQTFIRLMDELAGTENRIAVARKRYNDAVKEYNAAIRRFPGNVIAQFFNFKEQAYFEAPEETKKPPEVNF
ncbi:MAG: LemA family protein [Candidatus Bipolaricaulia bacterium]